MRNLFFVPIGGLGNRMRATASAVSLSRKLGIPVHIGWFKDWALNASFSSLFETPDIPGVKFSDVPRIMYWALDRPRKKNFFIPRLFQSIMFGQRIYEDETNRLYKEENDFSSYDFNIGKGIYMASCQPFLKYDKSLINKLFVPSKHIHTRIAERCCDFSEYTIGVHVRRTDHVLCINESPLELFYEYIDQELKIHPEAKIYLATDSEEVKAEFYNRYDGIVITSSAEARRDSTEGIQDGLVDMYSLSKTSKIYGSYGSTFSLLAADIGNIPFTAVRKHH